MQTDQCPVEFFQTVDAVLKVHLGGLVSHEPFQRIVLSVDDSKLSVVSHYHSLCCWRASSALTGDYDVNRRGK
jgi:hypothetical protein